MSDTTLNPKRQGLASRFIVPPFSTLDARSGRWQDRKRYWRGLGIGESGYSDPSTREAVTYGGGRAFGDASKALASRSSEFDPVLAEILIEWFSEPGDLVFDPFAGGPVRGRVAHALGRSYLGLDIRPDQIAHNQTTGKGPVWRCGDSKSADYPGDVSLIVACPPYGPLEKYSNDPDDLSNMDRGAYMSSMAKILHKCAASLLHGGMLALIVGDYRANDGTLWGIPSLLDVAAGEILSRQSRLVLLTRAGSAAIRAAGSMMNRRPVATHQEILIYSNGPPRRWQRDCAIWTEQEAAPSLPFGIRGEG